MSTTTTVLGAPSGVMQPPPHHQQSLGRNGSRSRGSLRVRRASPNSPADDPLSTPPAKPIVIPPPTLRPQHVYAPVAPLGMLTLGVFSKKKKGDDGQGDHGDGTKLMNGNGCFNSKSI